MNNSGKVLTFSPLNTYSAKDIIVVCDTLDLPAGVIRIKRGGGSAGHNGLKSLLANLSEHDFIRLYIGIGRPSPPESIVDFVLGVPHDDMEKALLQKGIDEATNALKDLINQVPLEEVSRAYNRRVTS